MKKRIISMFMCVMLLMTLVPATAYSEEYFLEEELFEEGYEPYYDDSLYEEFFMDEDMQDEILWIDESSYENENLKEWTQDEIFFNEEAILSEEITEENFDSALEETEFNSPDNANDEMLENFIVASDTEVFNASENGEKPEFIVQPVDVYGTINKRVTLTADAGDDVTYQWQCRKTESGAWTNIGESTSWVGATSKSLNFAVNASRATWTFRVIATNVGGETASNEVHIILGEPPVTGNPPEFSVQPVDAYGTIDKRVTLTADAGDNVTYQWQCRKTESGAWTNIGESTSWVGATSKALNFSVNASRATWTFRVIAANANGETASNEVHIILGEPPVTGNPPEFSVQPVDVYGTIDKRVTLTADAGDNVTYQWQCRKTESGAWTNIGESTSWVGATSKALNFSVNASRATWTFRVIAANASGETASNEVHIILGEPPVTGNPPEFSVQPVDVYGTINKRVTLTADAGDDVTYQWQCRKTESGAWTNIGESTSWVGATGKSLNFEVNASRATWTFRVIATNASGATASNEVHIILGNPPEFSVQPVDVYGTINKRVTLTADAGDDVTYQWQCRKTESGAWTNIGESTSWVGATGKSLNFEVNASRATWTFRVIATNALGETASNEVHIILGTLPKFSVQPVDVYGTINKRVTLTADAGDDVTYQWQCRKTESGAWTNIGESTSWVGATGKSLNFEVNASRATWTFRVIATNALGETASNEVHIILAYSLDDVEYVPITSSTCAVSSYSGVDSTLIIPEEVFGMTVTEVGEEAFMNNTSLVSIDLPDTIVAIRARAFKNCSNLREMK